MKSEMRTVYITDDGEEFFEEADALQHERGQVVQDLKRAANDAGMDPVHYIASTYQLTSKNDALVQDKAQADLLESAMDLTKCMLAGRSVDVHFMDSLLPTAERKALTRALISIAKARGKSTFGNDWMSALD